jgi:serine/threonine protein kinase
MKSNQKHILISRKGSNGTKVVYRRENELGRGGFAIVYNLVEVESNQVYALKQIDKELLGRNLDKLQVEISLQKSCNHPNIVRCFDSFGDANYQYLILEHCPCGSLQEKFTKEGLFSEQYVSNVAADIIQGVAYLHSKNILHRDIKLPNLLVASDGSIKLADFGLSFKLGDKSNGKTVCGTPKYLAPELLTRGPEAHSTKVDIWAIGVCVFILLNGYAPFEGFTAENTYEKIKTGKYYFNLVANLSEKAKDFLQMVLTADPERRPSLEQLKRHPFVAPRRTFTACDRPSGQKASISSSRSMIIGTKMPELSNENAAHDSLLMKSNKRQMRMSNDTAPQRETHFAYKYSPLLSEITTASRKAYY